MSAQKYSSVVGPLTGTEEDRIFLFGWVRGGSTKASLRLGGSLQERRLVSECAMLGSRVVQGLGGGRSFQGPWRVGLWREGLGMRSDQ